MTVVQMRLTPTPNADPAQAKMMQFMPLVFLFIYYSMPAALSLYSTANAVFTIVQQLIINRLKEPEDSLPATVAPGAKPIKNVTPPKKR
jgi:YidC/Oxa1 family membrane protein insertase